MPGLGNEPILAYKDGILFSPDTPCIVLPNVAGSDTTRESKLVNPSTSKVPLRSVLPSTLRFPIAEIVFTVIFGILINPLALPDVSWLPSVLTPGRLMSAVPSKDTPPISLAVCNFIASSAKSAVVTLPLKEPTKVVAVMMPDAWILPTELIPTPICEGGKPPTCNVLVALVVPIPQFISVSAMPVFELTNRVVGRFCRYWPSP